jgi:hypothetical protein
MDGQVRIKFSSKICGGDGLEPLDRCNPDSTSRGRKQAISVAKFAMKPSIQSMEDKFKE